MSPQVHVDPDEIDRFVRDLVRANGEFTATLKGLRIQSARLGETWRDQEHARFEREFEQALRALARFSTEATIHVAHLQRLSQAARIYLRQQ